MPSDTPKKSDVDLLAEGLDGTLRQKAEAVAKFVDGRISGLRDELIDLVGRQKANITAAEAEGSSEAKKLADESTAAVKAADQAVKRAEADPTPEKAKEAKDKVEEAAEAVGKTESDLSKRVSALEGGRANHEKRISALEEGQAGLAASVDGLWVSVRAHARAIATGGGAVTGLRRAGRLAVAAFVGVLAIWLLVVLVTPVTFMGSWNFGIGLAAIVAGLVFAVVTATIQDDIPHAEVDAEAGLDIVHGETVDHR